MSLRRRLSRFTVRTIKTKVAATRRGRPLVSFTFDDALDTAYRRGAALLEARGARGTFYVAGALIEAGEPGRAFMTPHEIVALHRRGHEIGCHTYSHQRVGRLSAAEIETDIDRNGAYLSSLDATIALESFAYPYNAATLRTKRLLQKRFASCRGGVHGVNAGRIDLGYLRGVELCDDLIDLDTVRARVADAVRRGGWLVFLTHGVTEAAEPWRVTPRLMEGAIAAAAAECEIVTVRDAVRRIIASKSSSRAGAA